MKTIEMIKTDTYKLPNGSCQVFGPRGKQFCVDDNVADTLVKNGSAKIIDSDRSEETEEKPALAV